MQQQAIPRINGDMLLVTMAITLTIAINHHLLLKNNHQAIAANNNQLPIVNSNHQLQQQFLKPMVAGAPCLVVITLPRIATAIAATFPEINAGFSHGNSIAE